MEGMGWLGFQLGFDTLLDAPGAKIKFSGDLARDGEVALAGGRETGRTQDPKDSSPGLMGRRATGNK